VWRILLRVNSDVQGCAKLDFPIRHRVSTASSHLPLHGPLLFAHATHRSHSLSVDIHTRYCSIFTSSNHPTAPYIAPSVTAETLPSALLPGTLRGETRNAFRGSHDRPAPNAPCFESGRRASLRESTAERYPAVTCSTPRQHPRHLNPIPAVHRVPTACRSFLHGPDRLDTTA
jgi:hypothetical protein